MPAHRKPPPSPLKTGITHTAIALLTFAGLSAAGVFAIQTLGNAEHATPKRTVGLFTAAPVGPLPLKERMSETSGFNEHQVSGPDTHEDEHTPNLGVADPGAEDMVHVSDDHGATDHETENNAEPDPSVALPKAPLPGMSEPSPQGALPIIAADGRKSFDVYRRPFSNPAGRPTISIVVGGLGLNARVTEAAISELPPDVTLSFVPYARDLQSWVDKARAAGHEVMVELPMEPYDYPNNDTGPYTLLTTANASENVRRLEWLLSRATGYFGVTNYQGAKFATDSRAITPVFEELEERGLAFIHDGSAPRSVFESSANSATLPFTEAARVIDAEPSGGAIDEQLLHLEAIALQRGYALGTGFAFPITIDQLRDWSQTLTSKGYLLAPASALPRTTTAYSLSSDTTQAIH
ncbi:MAG: hypothetical protein CMK06_06110 [Ponticaulis sp.]|nr:hypothetical protein [Ponticaulis sp.]